MEHKLEHESFKEQYELVLAREKDLQSMLQDREELLAKALQVKQEFFNHLEHEGHTPITGIASMGQALLADYDRLTDKQRLEGLRIIAKSSDRLLSFVDNLINIYGLNKLTIPAYHSTRERINLSKLVYDRLEHCQRLYLDNKNIEFITGIESDITLNGNLHHLSATIDSLIINAIKYNRYKGYTGKVVGGGKHPMEKENREENTKEENNGEGVPEKSTWRKINHRLLSLSGCTNPK